MNILWCAAGEDIEFPVRDGSTITSTTAAARRSTYVRASLSGQFNVTAGSIMADGQPISVPVTSCWFGGELYFDTNIVNGFNDPLERAIFGLGGSATLGGLFVGQNNVLSQTSLFKVNSAGSVTKLATEAGTSFTSTVLHRLDVQVTNWNNASTGNVKVYFNGNSSPVINFTGDLTSSGVTTLDRIRMLTPGAFGGTGYISECVIADDDTRGVLGVAGVYPNAAGDTNTWSSGAYTDIDEVVLDNTDFISSNAVSQLFECGMTNLPAGATAVLAFKLADCCAKGATGPDTQQLGIKSSSVVDVTSLEATTAFLFYQRLMQINPITLDSFTHAEIDAIQAAIKSA